MMDSDIIKRLLETERQAKALVDESQKISDRKIEDAIRVKQREFAASRECKIRELDSAYAEYKAEIEKKRLNEIEDYEKKMREEPLFLDEAERALRETLNIV
jgi:hypothetical protein